MSNQQSLLSYSSFYLVGIKGVAMTALAQCLVDAGKEVRGSDVEEDFVTKKQLQRINVAIDFSFDPSLIENADCVIYTAAHKGPQNPQVVEALQQNKPTFSHAEALGLLFNQKQGVAVCGVGGKSTTSAMITWILNLKATTKPSFAVGVGNIPGIESTGAWNETSKLFIAEADEYVIDPSAPSKNEPITPRFSFLHPWLTVCTNLKFDHPDVYKNFDHTKEVYDEFFSQIKEGGHLVVNGDDQPLVALANDWKQKTNQDIITFGTKDTCDVQLLDYKVEPGKTITTFSYRNQEHTLQLQIPGKFNVYNALAAIAAAIMLDIPAPDAAEALVTFASTMRRGEFIGEKQGVLYYDDYAHHPHEVKNIIAAFQEWFPEQRLVIAFQSHTFSRTKQLFDEFVDALGTAKEVVMIDIFASAREAYDDSVSSDILCKAIQEKNHETKATNLYTIEKLADFLTSELQPGDVVVTVGAGDIYQVHDLISK